MSFPRRRESSYKHSLDDRIIKINPTGISGFNQPYLPGTIPFLELLLAINSVEHALIKLVINEQVNEIMLGEAVDDTMFVLPSPFA